MSELHKKWVDALDVATSRRCSNHMELSPRIANAMIGASEFQNRLLKKLQEKIDLYPQSVFEENSPIISADGYREIIKMVQNLEPHVPVMAHSTTIRNGCPNCGGDVFDGTGTGWRICHKCGLMF